MKARHSIAAAVLGLSLTACGSADHELPQNVILAMQTRYNSNDAEGVANLYTDDGAIMQEFAPPVRGKAAILDFLHNNLRKQLQYWVTSEGSLASGDIGYDQGSYRVRDINRVKDLESGKYVIIYKKIHVELAVVAKWSNLPCFKFN